MMMPEFDGLYYSVVYERIEELVKEFFQNPKNAETVDIISNTIHILTSIGVLYQIYMRV